VRWGYPRLQSIFWHPGWLAEYVALLAPAALALGWAGATRARRWIGWGLALLMVVVQLLTMARAGWLALAAGYGIVALLALGRSGGPWSAAARRGLFKALMALGAFAIITGLLLALVPPLRARAGELLLYRNRTDIWQAGWGIVTVFPWSGCGLGNYFRTHVSFYDPSHPFVGHQDKVTAHNLYLHLWAERGAAGLILFLGVLGGGIWRACAAVMQPSPAQAGRSPVLRLAVAGGLAAFAVNGLFQYMFYVRAIDLIFWILLAMSGWGSVAAPLANRWRRPLRLAPWILLALAFFEHSWQFAPGRMPVGGRQLLIGGKRVELAVPPEGTRFRLWLGASQSNLAARPLTITARYDGAAVGRATFTEYAAQALVIELPADRPPWRRLELEASWVWHPFMEGFREPPLTDVGVLYEPLEPVGDSPEPGGGAGG
jgi:hypothetical protein